MKDDRKNEMRRQYGEMLEVQKRMRAVAEAHKLPVQLEADPAEPTSVDQLGDAMNVVRTNMNLLELTLNNWDRELNGCETRTKAAIISDIDHDMTLLAKNEPSPDGRTRGDIELNVAYDKMQLRRI